MPTRRRVRLEGGEEVTSLRYAPARKAKRQPFALLLGHGAGANQESDFMVGFAEALARRGIFNATFNFLYTEKKRKAPDRAPLLEACYGAVLRDLLASDALGGAQLFIGGKSMGGRIASQLAAGCELAIAGLVFLGYPLHPPGNPEKLRAEHLPRVRAPMLFVQGTRDPFGTPAELAPYLPKLSAGTTIHIVDGGDHSFKVPKKQGVSQEDVLRAIEERVVGFMGMFQT
jgi:predicted alpha/beta-hydrolase family hydrolase